jgi:hypothetical protein
VTLVCDSGSLNLKPLKDAATLQLHSCLLILYVSNVLFIIPLKVKVKVILRLTVSRPVCLGVRHPSGLHDQFSPSFLNIIDRYGVVDVGHLLWREVGSVIFICCWASLAQSFLGLSPAGPIIIFYCLNFLDSPNMEGQVPLFTSSPRNRLA